ncbi:MAG: glutamine--tRNA ligase/YqeY domain fusion protein [Lentisphaerae bacterium]|nr:glutamine--tRNA ligase/YqeY domain fusion protein [Lentisphaerota bacterium]
MSDMADTGKDFIREIVAEDFRSNKYGGSVVTRFPPEPNGCLHIGHAKAICLDFGIAAEGNGVCHLRFDDTNPVAEETEYVEAIKEDVHWLGWNWGEHLYYASDYFEQLYEYAVKLIKIGKAYVCALSVEEFKEYRGVPTRPGKESPSRNRSVKENLDLFERMRAGEFKDGEYVLRAKIDMSSPNLHMRDPAIYRIKHARHHRTGDRWCIYPMYDFAHCLSDAIENITHSLCTLEFEVHRPLYDWILQAVEMPEPRPRQIEFARLNLSYTVMSKRKLLQLVRAGYVSGWDDPRMPTLAGMRRRGYTAEAIRVFLQRIGITKVDGITDIALLEHCVREELNRTAPRVMAVLDPVKVVIENYPEDLEENMEAVNNPEDLSAGTRQVPFSRELYIEREDFRENPPGKFYRLAPGREVRLRYAYYITCASVIKDENGRIVEIRCIYDPNTRGGDSPDGRKVKGTLHWVSARHAVKAEARIYDRLFTKEIPEDVEEGDDYLKNFNFNSLVTATCMIEPSLQGAKPGDRFQFERKGYFCVDVVESREGALVFNQIVPLRDSWAKIEKTH